MESRGLKYRRSTLLSADVVGYSRMMELDEQRTVALLLKTIVCINQEIARFGGRLIDAPGDNVLAEFPEEGPALRAAIAIQQELSRRNRHAPAADRLSLRIGLHSGELLEIGGKLYGKTVNIAARLQQAAAPASIFLSEAVAERLEPEHAQRLLSLGDFRYKNLAEPVATLQACIGE
jgi:class 3 adenylate cyclase